MEFKHKIYLKRIFGVMLSATLLSLSLPYFDFGWLVWVALAPLFVVLRQSEKLRSVLLLTTVFGVIYGISVAFPLFQLTTTWWAGDIGLHGNSLLVVLIAGGAALYGALFFLPITYFIHQSRRIGTYSIFFVGLVWAIFEYIRAEYALLGYGWGTIGYALVDASFINPIVSQVGVYGLSFLIVTVNMTFALLWEQLSKENFHSPFAVLKNLITSPRGLSGVILLVLMWGGVMWYSWIRNTTAQAKLQSPINVGIVVSGSPDESNATALYVSYKEKITKLLREHPDTNIILFPENVFPFFQIDEISQKLSSDQLIPLSDREVLYRELLAVTEMYPSVIFAIGLHTNNSRQLHNTLAFYQNGKITTMMSKQKLVPFFEYAPLGLPIPLFETLSHGESGQDIKLFGSTLGMLMCSEISDGSILTSEVDIILSPSNDGVFASMLASRFHNVFARMRAIESGAYVVRANKGSISSIINPRGEVLETDIGDTILFHTLN